MPRNASSRPSRRDLSVLGPTWLWLLAVAWPLQSQSAPTQALFEDATRTAGIAFQHYNADAGELDLPEITGPGGAFLDADNDGDLDIYLVQGARLRPRSAPAGGDRLLSNQLIETGELRFLDVTEKIGLRADGYGMGVATGDIDNDGDVDVYVLNFGANQLWRNDGDRFTDATSKSVTELGGDAWSIAASFVDFDLDGWLDLYVVNYTDYPLDPPVRCFASSSRRDYCGPSAFEPASDRLFRNRGDGTFTDVSGPSGIGSKAGPSLGVVGGDFNQDGWPDFYVANDGAPNFLWLGSAGKTFRDEALFSGLALNQQGQPEASMGMAKGDFDRDGDPDLFLTHLDAETNTFYTNQGEGLWEDRTIQLSLAVSSRAMTGFGAVALDIDNDGWLDIAAVNGRVRLPETVTGVGKASDLVQVNQLWRNLQGKSFEDVSAAAGEGFLGPEVSRGLARGDVDNDGDADLLLLNNSGPARLLLNRLGSRQRWMGVRVIERGRDAIGARVELQGTSASIQTDGSYASAHDPRLIYGLGSFGSPSAIRVTWLDGKTESWPLPKAGQYTTLTRGSGQ